MNNSRYPEQAEIIKAANELVTALNNSKYSFKRQLWQNILLGAMTALGGVLALAVLIPFIVYLLSKLEYIPAIGDFVKQIVDHIQSTI